MNINWKLRLQNKTTLFALLASIVTFVYTFLGLLNIVPSVTENMVIEVITLFINILVLAGIVVDPTTEGVNDSIRAMNYTEPK